MFKQKTKNNEEEMCNSLWSTGIPKLSMKLLKLTEVENEC